MRRLVWFSLGFGVLCGLWAYGWWMPGPWILLLLGGVCLLGGRKSRSLMRGLWLVLGCLAALGWTAFFASGRLAPLQVLDQKQQEAVISIQEDSWPGKYGTVAEGKLHLSGRDYGLRLYLQESRSLQPGDQVEGTFFFRTTRSENRYYVGKGIFLLAYQASDSVTVSHPLQPQWKTLPARIRRQFQQTLSQCLPPETAGFARAVLLGDTAGLSYSVDTQLKISGLRHVAAVSGLHVSVLFALVMNITFRKRYLSALVGFPVLLLFAGVTGFSPSVSRACLMAALMLLAQLGSREYDGPTALAFSGVLMLLVNPLVVTNVSFQLSIASVAGIFLFQPPIYRWLISVKPGTGGKKIWSLISGSVSVTLGATVLTTPLCAWYFGTVSLVGILTNLLTLWAVVAVFYGSLGLCLLGPLWSLGGNLLGKALAWLIRYILAVSGWLADLPLAAIYTESIYVVAWLVFVYLLLGAFLVMKKRLPGVFLGCGSFGLCLALLLSFLEPMADQVRMTMLDVGQGQCILLQTEGRSFLVDCGGDRADDVADLAAQTLLSQGIPKLDGVILTHDDQDHANGLGNLLSRVDTDLLVLPPGGMAQMPETEGTVVYAKENMEISLGKSRIQIFAPKFLGDANETSVCVLFQGEKCDILITGDRSSFGERSLLQQEQIPQVDILVAGHHGSGDSTCEALLMETRPKVVCISVGRDNPYGHPAPELLQRLERFGCQVCRTDQNGRILIRR